MARLSTSLMVGFVGINAFAGLLREMQVFAALGLSGPGVDGSVSDEVRRQSQNITTGTGFGDTLFGLYNVIGGWFTGLFEQVFPALDLLARAGVPEPIITLLGTMSLLVMGIGIAMIIRGI